MLRSTVLLLLLAAPIHGAEPSSAELPKHVGRTITAFKLRDYLGTWHRLEDFTKNRLVVVAFLGTECPLSKLHGARLAELSKQYGPRNVAFIGINSNQQDSLDEIAHNARASKIDFPVLKDPGNEIADQFQAERTPEVFVLDSKASRSLLGTNRRPVRSRLRAFGGEAKLS